MWYTSQGGGQKSQLIGWIKQVKSTGSNSPADSSSGGSSIGDNFMGANSPRGEKFT